VSDDPTITFRRATAADVDFLCELLNDPDVEPFLSGRDPRTPDSIAADVARSDAEPETFGRFVIEVDGERAGAFQFACTNERSRIARVGGLAVAPAFRGMHVADDAARLFQRYLLCDLDYHRLELEVYGFNERAQRHAERAGFVREGVKRRAYRRHGEWVDGVLYGLLREDLDGLVASDR
jgi:RimJ/RimL family protein N-acetyltransferase